MSGSKDDEAGREWACARCGAPMGALDRLTAMLPTIEGVSIRDRWMEALFFAEQLKRELDHVQRRNAVPERRIKLLVEVGRGAIEDDDVREEIEDE